MLSFVMFSVRSEMRIANRLLISMAFFIFIQFYFVSRSLVFLVLNSTELFKKY